MTTRVGTHGLLTALVLASWPAASRGEEDDLAFGEPRREHVVLPNVGATPDLGFIFGFGVTDSVLDGLTEPYARQLNYYFAASVKEGPGGTEYPLRKAGIDGDFPALGGGRLRLGWSLAHFRTTDAGWFGIGNDSSATVPAASTAPEGRFFQYTSEETRASIAGRWRREGAADVLAGVSLSFASPRAYPGSRLDLDAADPLLGLRGAGDHIALELASGVLFDSRDEETWPGRGGRTGASFRLGAAFGDGDPFSYAGATVDARRYATLGMNEHGSIVLASRLVLDALAGDPPFYELTRAGGLSRIEAPGGAAAVRGVPSGRFAGKLKGVASLEFRAPFADWRSPAMRYVLSGVLFADVGGAWAGEGFDTSLDRGGPGLVHGLGLGGQLRMGEAVVARLDLAWSPWADDDGSSNSLGIYLVMSTAF